MVNPGIEVSLDQLALNLVMRATGKTTSVYEDDQRCRTGYVCFPEVDYLIGVISIGNIFVGDRGYGNLLLRLNRVGRIRGPGSIGCLCEEHGRQTQKQADDPVFHVLLFLFDSVICQDSNH